MISFLRRSKFGFCQAQVVRKKFADYLERTTNIGEAYTPKRIVQYLDSHVVGQQDAKRAVAISLRNRWRRKFLPDRIKEEIMPKNILISGPTGCGKTQIARRLAKLTQSPFIRVQLAILGKMLALSQKICTSLILNLAKIGLNEVKKIHQVMKNEQKKSVQDTVFNDLADVLLGKDWKNDQIRKKKIKDLKAGKYKNMPITIYPKQLKLWSYAPENSFLTATVDQIQYSLFQIYHERNRMHEKSINLEKQAIKKVEQQGIVFLDQIDKLAISDKQISSRSISREGVQRDLLPIIEGTTVSTKIGDIKTDNILFIASGSFSMANIEDLIPQLMGRLPIRVTMNPLSEQQLYKILVTPKYNLLMQQKNLLAQEGINLVFTEDSIREIARFSCQMNKNKENMGARRLQAVTEKVIEDISYEANQHKDKKIIIDAEYVRDKCKGWDEKVQLGKYLI